MNFVTDLSESKNYNTIFMIINRLMKMRHYIIYKAEENKISIEQTVQMYIKYI